MTLRNRASWQKVVTSMVLSDVLPLLEGGIDLHAHAAPSIFPRALDDFELASQAREVGMAAVVIKSHESSTVDRATAVKRCVEGIDAFGGIVMNASVGGLNPVAAEVALELGGRIVWMPTLSSIHHRRVTAQHPFLKTGVNLPAGDITVLDDTGRLTRSALAVLEVCLSRDAIVGTGHLSIPEIEALAGEYLRHSGAKLLIGHAELHLTDMPVERQVHLARRGAIIEKCFLASYPDWGDASMQRIAESIRTIGPESCVLVTDAGMEGKPTPVEAMKAFIQALLREGIGAAAIGTMLVDNPRRLLGL
jgi:hypothetical protein